MSTMLEDMDLTKKMGKKEFNELYPPLKERLGELQREMRVKGLPVIVVFEGLDPVRTVDTVSKFLLPLDPRGFRYHNTRAPAQLDKEHPFMWRFWVRTPARGQMVIFDRSWYARALAAGSDGLDGRIAEVRRFEKTLSDGGTLFLKFFLYTDPGRLSDCADGECGITDEDLVFGAMEEAIPMMERMMSLTTTEQAPWTVVEAEDAEYAAIKVMRNAIARLEAALASAPAERQIFLPEVEARSPLASIDLRQSVKDSDYEKELERLQKKIRKRQEELYRSKRSLIVVFEGRDASGKGGGISRLTNSLNPRTSKVVPIYAPTEQEKAHHYLWRFYRALPSRGHIAIFDRSWYGRVLVERVDELASEAEWSRAYDEINDFERSLIDDGAELVKIWLEIDKQEQLKRFIDRVDDPKKSWKITADDWSSRQKWDRYTVAVDEMLVRTSTGTAPWTVVEGNDKNFARLKTIRTVLDSTNNI